MFVVENQVQIVFGGFVGAAAGFDEVDGAATEEFRRVELVFEDQDAGQSVDCARVGWIDAERLEEFSLRLFEERVARNRPT